MIKKFKIFETNYKNQIYENCMSKFYVDIRNCSNDQKRTALNMLENITNLRFNGTSNKFQFIIKKDQSGKAWCWRIKKEKGMWGKNNFYVSGIHTKNWGMPEIEKTMIPCEMFIKIGAENVETYLMTNKYNL